MTDRLLELLRERSYARRRVVLASGKESDFFIDCKQTVLLAEGHALVGAALHARIAAHPSRPAAVAGVVLGGCPLASAVALVSFERGAPLDAIYVRKAPKDHGSARRIEGDAHLAAGTCVVVVEDVVTTGGSTLEAVGALREAGYEVPLVVALVDRREGGAEAITGAGIAFEAIYGREDFLGGGP
ncbi:MAG: orotate phosphoribosyltransferase [Sandaracinaceae bacterium]|nr:orotate phosphoribosyltransferase [Sandaracinaceae bacterium]